MYVALQLTARLAILSEPFLPFTSLKLKKMLDIEAVSWNDADKKEILAVGHQTGTPELLFQNIDDEKIKAQLEKLEQTKLDNAKAEAVAKPQKPVIEYDDFVKNDIRIGTILEAQKVPKTQKLMQLKIDTGIDVRTVVSGIAEHFKPEDVVGKQVAILVNLAPRKIKGIESQGMILMAEDFDGKLVFVLPSAPVSNGSTVQ
jgi:methionyl-tRNA synthetase